MESYGTRPQSTWMLEISSIFFIDATWFQSSAVEGDRPDIMCSVVFSLTIGMPVALMFGSGLLILSSTSSVGLSPEHALRSAAAARPETAGARGGRTERRVRERIDLLRSGDRTVGGSWTESSGGDDQPV